MENTGNNVGSFGGHQDAKEARSEIVEKLRKDESDTDFSVLILNDGEVYGLRKDDPRYEGWVRFLYESKLRDPIYIETEPGTRIVTRMLAPLPRKVQYLSPELEKGRLEVMLLLCPSVCYLNPDLGKEKFNRFREQLEYAMRAKTELLVTTRPSTMEILDVSPPRDREAGFEEASNGPAAIQIEAPGGSGPQQAEAIVAQIPMAQATTEFNKLASQPQIPFNFVRDCCTGRAHEMCRIMEGDGLSPRKVWNYGHGWALTHQRATLRVMTNLVPEGFVMWSYHVAPVIPVRLNDGAIQEMVMDPSLFTHPVTIDEWVARQQDLTSAIHERVARFLWFDYLNGQTITDSHYATTNEQFRSHRLAANDEHH